MFSKQVLFHLIILKCISKLKNKKSKKWLHTNHLLKYFLIHIFCSVFKKIFFFRPGRPPKRMTPITTFASMPGHNVDLFNSMPRSIGSIPFPPPPSSRDIPPFHPFMSLSGQSQVSFKFYSSKEILY